MVTEMVQIKIHILRPHQECQHTNVSFSIPFYVVRIFDSVAFAKRAPELVLDHIDERKKIHLIYMRQCSKLGKAASNIFIESSECEQDKTYPKLGTEITRPPDMQINWIPLRVYVHCHLGRTK